VAEMLGYHLTKPEPVRTNLQHDVQSSSIKQRIIISNFLIYIVASIILKLILILNTQIPHHGNQQQHQLRNVIDFQNGYKRGRIRQ
jgi:hypothetical protein